MRHTRSESPEFTAALSPSRRNDAGADPIGRTNLQDAVLTVLAALCCVAAGCAALPGGSGAGGSAPSAAITATIPIGSGPILLAITPDGAHLYAAANNGLHVIDTKTNAVVTSLNTLPNAAGLAISATGNRGLLTNLFSLQLTVIDTEVRTLMDSISLFSQGTRPAYGRVAASSDGATAYVVDQIGKNLVVVDTATGATPMALGLDLQPTDVAISPDGRWAYVCGCKSFCTPGTAQRFDTQEKRFGETFAVGPSPYRIAFSPDGKVLYTANLGDGSISVVDVANLSLAANVTVAPQLTGLAVANDGEWVYTVSRASNQLAVIDAGENEVHAKMGVGPSPREVVLSPDGRRAYVSTAGAVVVVDTEAFRESS